MALKQGVELTIFAVKDKFNFVIQYGTTAQPSGNAVDHLSYDLATQTANFKDDFCDVFIRKQLLQSK